MVYYRVWEKEKEKTSKDNQCKSEGGLLRFTLLICILGEIIVNKFETVEEVQKIMK